MEDNTESGNTDKSHYIQPIQKRFYFGIIFFVTVETKDIIYLITYVITIITIFLSFKNRLNNLEKELKRGGEVIFGRQGKLNLVDCDTCKDHRDQIFSAIRRSENVMAAALQKMETMNSNIIKIMVHLQIDNET